MSVESYKAEIDTYKAILRCYEAIRLPVAGIVKRYRGTMYDDFGNQRIVFVSSTEHVSDDGLIQWSEGVVER
jgi:hypothetical protein